mmetsp:Transcript_103537/g.200604  ORF Transcript_103537/g.200604 Transcript_103537/m.200604 type:complete len:94 (+) Transcript_103537:67-348(+)|eukprot:CAMPEP_0172657960 /NCGR_PEP_ID=MMETSP1074-20121228/2458_1 /TAXON_ID=2916 /ORGANISM="Ceratium fusus, Strain PA161109" /LENGTH=93 /DNA_ID=CAMNT_0013473169 /DNA_START=74 /DNA_END=355 /DNA_ORIENTATION=-
MAHTKEDKNAAKDAVKAAMEAVFKAPEMNWDKYWEAVHAQNSQADKKLTMDTFIEMAGGIEEKLTQKNVEDWIDKVDKDKKWVTYSEKDPEKK